MSIAHSPPENSKNHKWKEATPQAPCPACGKPDWCAIADGGALVRCMRSEIASTPSGYHRVRDHPDGGRLYGRDGDTPIVTKRIAVAKPRIDWAAMADRFGAAIIYSQVEELAMMLSVNVDSLYRCGIGWDATCEVFTFPERNGAGNIIGVTTRAIDGMKRCIRGSERGLTIPAGFDRESAEPLLLAEGVTDVCACLTLEISAIGRPSCCGGVAHLAELLRGYGGEIFVVGENDPKPDGRWPGRDGAMATAKQLACKLNRPVQWTMTPHGAKDIRAWLADHDAHLTEELREVLL